MKKIQVKEEKERKRGGGGRLREYEESMFQKNPLFKTHGSIYVQNANNCEYFALKIMLINLRIVPTWYMQSWVSQFIRYVQEVVTHFI